MRIGLSGAQSVGKTTLLSALRSEKIFNGFTICDEVTRRVASYGLPINEGGNSLTQKLIMHEHIVNVFMYDKMITDRTALDGLVYTEYLRINGKIKDDDYYHVRDIFQRVAPMYDYMFYIPPEFPIVDDGVRSTDNKFREEISYIFESKIKKYNLNVIRVTGSVRDRVTKVVEIIEGR